MTWISLTVLLFLAGLCAVLGYLQAELNFSNKSYKLALFYLTFQVLHLQLLNSPSLCPRVIVESDRSILSGHFTKMTVLAKVCKHVASIYFGVEISVDDHTSKTIIDHKAYWVTPLRNAWKLPS